MKLLQKEEYNISYFDGKLSRIKHNAGYDFYNKSEVFNKRAKYLFEKYNLKDKKVLDIGCAKGYLVEELRNMKVDAYGVDFSEYALLEAPSSISKYLFNGDLKDCLKTFNKNHFDLICSRFVLSCFDDKQIEDLVKDCNSVSVFQNHLISHEPNIKFYNSKTLEEWEIFDWKKGTELSTIYKTIVK